MSEHNGKSQPAQPKRKYPVGNYTGERVKALRPDTYRRVVELLAEPREQVSVNEICHLLHVTDNTVRAIEKAEAVSIAERKERLLRKSLRVAAKAIDRVEDQIDGAGITQATVAFGVATEKALLLSAADPFAAQQHLHQHLHFERRDISGEFNAWHAQLEAAANAMNELPPEKQGPIKALLESLLKFGPQPLPAPAMLPADSQAQNS